MKVFITWAHQGEDWSATQVEKWRTSVHALATLLQGQDGIDVELDLWHTNDPNVDWTRWGPGQIETCDVVLIAMNEPWAQRWKGENTPTIGSGVVAEANALHGLFGRDQAEFHRRVRIALLPGTHERSIPNQLYPLKRAAINQLSTEGISELVADLKGLETYPREAIDKGDAAFDAQQDPTSFTDDSFLLFRYRDLLPLSTILEHQRTLEDNPDKYVWWGWWKRFHEHHQLGLWRSFAQSLQAGPRIVGLFDSGSANGEVRRALVSDVLIPRVDDFDDCQPFTPEPAEWEHIPPYYRPREEGNSRSCAWLCLISISANAFPFFGHFEFVSADMSSNGRVISQTEQLTAQDQTLWHLRKTRRA